MAEHCPGCDGDHAPNEINQEDLKEDHLKLLLKFMKWVADEKVKVYRDHTEDVARRFLEMPPRPRKQTAKGYIGESDCSVAQRIKRGY